MTRFPSDRHSDSRSASQPTSRKPDPLGDPMGAFLLRQRTEVAPGLERPRPIDATDRITDPDAITALLQATSAFMEGEEDDLLFELLYLESLVAAEPVRSDELLAQLGALGHDIRDALLPDSLADVAALRQRTHRLKQHLGHMAGKLSATMVMLLTTVPMVGQHAAAAAELDRALDTFQIAAAPVVRVIDANSGAGLAGVTIKSMEEKVLGVTDANGQATLAEDYRTADLMSLEKNGYELSLLERSQLAARNIVSMKPLKDGAQTAAKPPAPANRPAVKPPVAPHGPTPPQVAMTSNHTPQLTPPRPPVMPKAPQVKLPARPKPSVPMLAAKPHAPALKPMATQPAADPMLASLPAHPRPSTQQQAAAPRIDAPTLPKPQLPARPRELSKPQLPALARAPKPQTAMSLPARPRKPMQTAAKPPMQTAAKPMQTAANPNAQSPTLALPRAPRPMAVPKRVPPATRMASTPRASGAYHVRPGDSLSKLAKRYLGSARRWPELYAMNRSSVHNPRMIRVGQVLNLPGAGGSFASSGHRAYVVRRGDSLVKIARQQLGSPSRWASLYQANRDHIRNARVIFPGQRLYLPV